MSTYSLSGGEFISTQEYLKVANSNIAATSVQNHLTAASDEEIELVVFYYAQTAGSIGVETLRLEIVDSDDEILHYIASTDVPINNPTVKNGDALPKFRMPIGSTLRSNNLGGGAQVSFRISYRRVKKSPSA